MAQKVQVTLVCDLHENDVAGTESISFGLDGAGYEIDVCDAHAQQLRDAFAPFVGAARRAGRPGAVGRRSGTAKSRAPRGGADASRVQDIRDWARKNGHTVSERGRLSASVVSAYEAAH